LKRLYLWIGVVLVAIVAAALWFWSGQRTSQAQPRFITETVSRGNLTVKVTATGTLQPTNKVDVGSELSGTVARVLVDINDRVKKDHVLAELDTSKLRAQVDRSRASLGVAEANLRQARATAQESGANLKRLQDVRQLSGGKVPSEAELASAQASVARANAAVSSGEASVADAKAALSADETNLRKASIRSPIDGVVLARNVDPGNAVAASLQAVTLFTLAEDLARMKLEVNVDEADVGLVKQGQKATFTVSAYPSRDYPARITRVSYGSTIKDNVVTYEADLTVANDDLSLRPGMSATATIIAAERTDAMLVPNAALRWSPDASPSNPGNAAAATSGGIVSKLMPRGIPRGPRKAGTSGVVSRQVWVLENGQPTAVAITPGLSDGRMTEVTTDALKPGMAVITGQDRAAR
jgi:HlyD family secretion protein